MKVLSRKRVNIHANTIDSMLRCTEKHHSPHQDRHRLLLRLRLDQPLQASLFDVAPRHSSYTQLGAGVRKERAWRVRWAYAKSSRSLVFLVNGYSDTLNAMSSMNSFSTSIVLHRRHKRGRIKKRWIFEEVATSCLPSSARP